MEFSKLHKGQVQDLIEQQTNNLKNFSNLNINNLEKQNLYRQVKEVQSNTENNVQKIVQFSQEDRQNHIIFYLKQFLNYPNQQHTWDNHKLSNIYYRMAKFLKGKNMKTCKKYNQYLRRQFYENYPIFTEFILNEAERFTTQNSVINNLLDKINRKNQFSMTHMNLIKKKITNYKLLSDKADNLLKLVNKM